MIYFLLKGMFIGLAIAAPVGPIAILCVKKTLTHGRKSGLACGLGASVADLTYGAIAAFGLTAVSEFFLAIQFWLRLFGGLFLIYLGFRILLSKVHKKDLSSLKQNIWKDFSTTFVLTFMNPITILSFVAVFASLGIVMQNYIDSSVLVLGVFLGSLLWWVFLSEVVTFFQKKIREELLLWVHQIAGVFILGFGFYGLFSAFTLNP